MLEKYKYRNLSCTTYAAFSGIIEGVMAFNGYIREGGKEVTKGVDVPAPYGR